MLQCSHVRSGTHSHVAPRLCRDLSGTGVPACWRTANFCSLWCATRWVTLAGRCSCVDASVFVCLQVRDGVIPAGQLPHVLAQVAMLEWIAGADSVAVEAAFEKALGHFPSPRQLESRIGKRVRARYPGKEVFNLSWCVAWARAWLRVAVLAVLAVRHTPVAVLPMSAAPGMT